jgi:putative flippase GtrA
MIGKPSQGLVASISGLISRNERKLRFALGGLVNTIFGLTIYPLLLLSFGILRQHYMIGLAIAQATSLCFAFMVYKWGVFKTRANIAREFWTFSSFYLVNYVLNWLALPLLVELAQIPPIWAQMIFSAILIVGSYFWHSRLTFRSERKP